MDEIENKQQYVESIFKDVVKAFPEIKEDEIKIEIFPFLKKSALHSILNKEKTKKESKIYVGIHFFECTKEEQEGILAHEIGHHKTDEKHTIPRIQRSYKWTNMFENNIIPDSRPHWKQRLKQTYLLNEMAADNEAAKTEHGKKYLEVYKKYLPNNHEIYQALIKNLEEKLGERNE